MRAILIDPVAKSISEVDYSGNYRDIHVLLSDKAHGLEVDYFDVVRLDGGETIYIDDEGLLKNPEYFFEYGDYSQPLAGRGLILGSNDQGESIASALDIEAVRAKVTWPELQVEGFDPIPEGTMREIPGFGAVPVIGHTPVFKRK